MGMFPDLTAPPPKPQPRWCRLTVTLGPEGRVLASEVEAITPEGAVVLHRGFYPAPGHTGSLDAIADVLRMGQELVLD